nr:tyrosine-protein kinase transmembrane receptor Ror-like [Onthophagus taurus]
MSKSKFYLTFLTSFSFSDSSSERAFMFKPGSCSKGVCSPEAACVSYENNTFICLCTHDSHPPTIDGRCPTRNVVPLHSGRRIIGVRPPVDNGTAIKNKTALANLNSTTSGAKVFGQPVINDPSTFAQQSYLLVSLLGTCIVLFIIVLFCCVIYKRKSMKSNAPSIRVLKTNPLMADRYAPNPQYSTCPSTAAPILKRENLMFLNEIGEGCFGKVYKGELQTGSNQAEIVAIKVLKETASREAEEDFLREVDIMSAFRHTNILSLLGVVLRENSVSPMMVFEYMPHGDLAEVLRAQKRQRIEDECKPILTTKQLLSIALQISAGMRYLAAQRFVHRDLACRNCLVADGPIVKIADFGMSRDVYTCDYYKIGGSRLLPVRWMSPESIIYGRFTLESDIWSYGVVLWEIYSFGKQPYYGHTNEEVVNLILQGIMLIPPEDIPQVICELMQMCWKTQAKDRIRFSDIYTKLEKAYDSHEDFENEKLINSLKRLPRPPPIPLTPCLDLLDKQGYLLPNSKDVAPYLETLPV